jgi:hypothetical protein
VVDTLDRRPQAHNKYIKTEFTSCSEDDALYPSTTFLIIKLQNQTAVKIEPQ